MIDGAEKTMSAVVLGIDGGGTRTRASIVEGDKILAFAENGSIKRLRVGAQAAEEHLHNGSARGFGRSGKCHHAGSSGVDRHGFLSFRRGAV